MSSTADNEIAGPIRQAALAHLYGYPLVYNLREIAKFPTGPNLTGPEAVAFNTFGYARTLLDHTARFVSPNNDTLYLVAMCDVGNGPLVLHVPNTNDRYYVLQFVDAWTNNFAYIGRRATGTAAARFLLAARDYKGGVPDDMRIIHSPTGLFAIVGRIAVNGIDDLPAAHALQDRFSLEPLSVYLGGGNPRPVTGVPKPDPHVDESLRWWEAFRVALAAFPPPAADAPLLAVCEQLGLTAEQSPFIDPNPALAEMLIAGQEAAETNLEELIHSAAKPVNGWQSSMHLFDYNNDSFEIGTLDTPEWRIPDRRTAYVTRAVAARAGLWGNHGYEADYEITYVDADGRPLDSAYRYELRLPAPPPVDAFWSLTMYDAHDFYLVENPINRYSIGDRTPGLQYGSDGSLTLYIQRESPGFGKESNWLPTPQKGPFRPIMRLYQPQRPILDGSYTLPGIIRVN